MTQNKNRTRIPVIVEFTRKDLAREYVIGSSLNEILGDVRADLEFCLAYKQITLDEAESMTLGYYREGYRAVSLGGCKAFMLKAPRKYKTTEPQGNLPTFAEIKEFVTGSPEFRAKLTEAGKLTLKTGKEVALELRLDLQKCEKYLTNISMGSERRAEPVENIPGASQNYLTLMHLHSHPGVRVICPSSGDILSSYALLSRNLFELDNYLQGSSKYPDPNEAIRKARNDYCWAPTQAIISVKEDLSLKMLLFRTSLLFPEEMPEKDGPKKSQADIMRMLKSHGSKAEVINYKLGPNQIYEPAT